MATDRVDSLVLGWWLSGTRKSSSRCGHGNLEKPRRTVSACLWCGLPWQTTWLSMFSGYTEPLFPQSSNAEKKVARDKQQKSLTDDM
ncbi:hypothetical protein BaRGS_00019139 [Batillaria attramentaria]|uniref:Uncharacterized protein n=1 Tax=Batillaria attramentaria TaxID=370345 RepID=A0ABD0KS81_9CAEN